MHHSAFGEMQTKRLVGDAVHALVDRVEDGAEGVTSFRREGRGNAGEEGRARVEVKDATGRFDAEAVGASSRSRVGFQDGDGIVVE
mmetsp:Transcript_47102/g.56978  ORF Transcript_47102/g.56978 Transcript_47102/m.56978 type:complete len:86 (-) Transcript_47102:304-561(-)